MSRRYSENGETELDVGDNQGIPQWSDYTPPNQTSGAPPIYPRIVPVEGQAPSDVDTTGEPFEAKPNVAGGPSGISNPRRTLNVLGVGPQNVYSAQRQQSQAPSLGTLLLIGLGLWLVFGDKK